MENLPFSPHEVVLEVLTGDWVFKLRLDDVRRPRLKYYTISIVPSDVFNTIMIIVTIICTEDWVLELGT